MITVQRKNESVLDSTTDGIILIALNGRFKNWSRTKRIVKCRAVLETAIECVTV